ncbi:MAG: DNA photolyase [Proteobacteria bacterium]|nr:DNA photolyase [Pseudomonadota bacterium]MBU1688228.1 DNA photolyase [Pseudomonadota bacterium]
MPIPPLHTHLNDPVSLISAIFVDQEALGFPLTEKILARAAGIPITFLRAGETPLSHQKDFPTLYPEQLGQGKRLLLLTKNRGRFLKACPATREYCCCDYQVLNIGMNCPMDCVYCILQAYLNTPWLTFFVNTEDLFAELIQAQAETPAKVRRIGTGEFTDSMALDSLTGLSRDLVDFFNNRPGMVLELKTKSGAIDNLLDLGHDGRTIVAWSLNAPKIIRREELKTASLTERLKAAARCASLGYRLAFHFDPVIFHDGWQEGYRETIRMLFAAAPADKITWISIGALRYLPTLKDIATSRFPGSRFFHEEFILGLDGKKRYFRTLRVEMYRLIVEELRQRADPATCIYLCMESDEIWHEVFGYTPTEKGGLPAMLDQAAAF